MKESRPCPSPKTVPRGQDCKTSREGEPERIMGASQDVGHQYAPSSLQARLR